MAWLKKKISGVIATTTRFTMSVLAFQNTATIEATTTTFTSV